MTKEKSTHKDHSETTDDVNFCKINITISVKANQSFKLRARAQWMLIDWGENGWKKERQHTFRKEGIYHIKFIGERIMWLNINHWNATFLDLENCPFLTQLRCCQNEFQNLNFQNCPILQYVDCSHNKLEYVWITNRKRLQKFYGNNNNLRVIDFSGCYMLSIVELNDNDIFVIIIGESLKIENLWLNSIRFRPEQYVKNSSSFPAVIINARDVLTN